MKTLRNLQITGVLLQNGTGLEAQVGDQVRLHLDQAAHPGFPAQVLGTIQHPIVSNQCATRTTYSVSYDENDLLDVVALLVPDDVVDVTVVSALDAVVETLAAETQARIATDATKQPLAAALTAYAADPIATILANMPDALTFAGADPNVASGAVASGTMSLEEVYVEGNFFPEDPFTVGGQVFRFRQAENPIVDPLRINVGVDFAATVANLVAVVSANSDFALLFTGPHSLEITADDAGAAGNVVVSHNHAGELNSITLTGGVTGDAPTATHLGQLCRASTAWWIWNGTAWIPWATLDGSPIAYNATLSTYRKLTVSGADGSEIITISAL